MTDKASVYAASLFSLAEDEGISSEIFDEIRTASVLSAENPEYAAILDSPLLPLVKRHELIDEAFAGAHLYTLNFLKLLCEKRSIHLLGDCVKYYEKVYNKKNNIEKVSVISAYELAENVRNRIVKKLENDMKKTVIPTFITDKSIIGGIIIRTENSQTDASVRARLNAVRAALASAENMN